MKLGIIGRGRWGNVYAETLTRMGVDFWQAGEFWQAKDAPAGIIVASAAESHAGIAADLIRSGIPALIEKPLCLTAEYARFLLDLAHDFPSIVFTGHTRLYSTAWRDFKALAMAHGVKSVHAVAGSKDCKLDPLWDWGPHLIAMCLDLGFDPQQARIVTSAQDWPLKVIVNGTLVYTDKQETPSPLEVLLTEFMGAIEKGEPDIRGLELGVKVVQEIEAIEAQETA